MNDFNQTIFLPPRNTTVNPSNVDDNSTQNNIFSDRYFKRYKYTNTEGITMTK